MVFVGDQNKYVIKLWNKTFCTYNATPVPPKYH